MNRIKASLGITALVVASLGLTAPSQANPTNAPSAISFETTEAALTFEEVQVTTEPAPAPEPTPTPRETTVPATTPEEETVLAKPTELPVTPSAATATETQAPTPAPSPAPTPSPGPSENAAQAATEATADVYWKTSDAPDAARLWWNQGNTVEAYEVFKGQAPEVEDAARQQLFTAKFRGAYVEGYAPANCLVLPSVETPEKVYAFDQ